MIKDMKILLNYTNYPYTLNVKTGYSSSLRL